MARRGRLRYLIAKRMFTIKSHEIRPCKGQARSLALVLTLLACQAASGQAAPADTPHRMAESSKPEKAAIRQPPANIASVEAAQKILADTEQERNRVEQQYAQEYSVCAGKFMVNACMAEAKERRRQGLARLRPAELDAGLYIRRSKALERDKALAEKQSQDIQKNSLSPSAEQTAPSQAQPQPEENPATGGQPAVDDAADAAKRMAGNRQRMAQHEAKLQRQAKDDAAMAQKQAANIAAYEKKVKESEERQREVATKKVEKEKELKARQENVAK